MELNLLRRPTLDFLAARSRRLLPTTTRRHESTHRRSRKLLNIAPAPSFLSSSESPKQDHIIFNPPSSVPSVLHTPLKFLPKDDERRKLYASAPHASKIESQAPIVKTKGSTYQRHHLTPEDAGEIRRLRLSDPVQWSRLRLAKRFNCSTMFVAICCEAPAEKKAAEEAKKAAFKARWGPRKMKAAVDRARRKELWFREE